jgi:hypothetical protein
MVCGSGSKGDGQKLNRYTLANPSVHESSFKVRG